MAKAKKKATKSAAGKTPSSKLESNREILENVALRAHYLATQMIHLANNRKDKEKGDPKVGGHPAACASALHIMGALHLVCKTGFDHIANKPHASPVDHAYNYLLDLFLKDDLSKLSKDEKNTAMHGLRAFSQNGEPVFQSYHSAYDPDQHNFAPSGTVGIPPVNIGYLALAYRFAKGHGYEVPDAHFWAVMGDSEYREGSLHEALPDFAERELGNLTWIVDYNRQSLDGHRITNKEIMDGTDNERIERTAVANGWKVIQVRHGKKREALFAKPDGELFRKFLEDDLEDYELQALLLVQDMTALRKGFIKEHPQLKKFLSNVSDEELFEGIRDMGGHDMLSLAEAMLESQENPKQPTLIIAHTVKGWQLKMAAAQGNHSSLPAQSEVDELRERQGLTEDNLFDTFAEGSKEFQFLQERGDFLYGGIRAQHDLKRRNEEVFIKALDEFGDIPDTLDINLKMASYPHTQWMLGQLTSKLTRIANTSLQEKKLNEKQKALSDFEKSWKTPAELLVTMAPDVGTSTNLNPSMDGKIFGAAVVDDLESEFGVKDEKLPDLVPGEDNSDRFLRFDIAECNVMSCLGSYGKMKDFLGLPILPLMTVYDFFVKRALDQLFYDLYWKSSFILVGTPAGVSLSPEGAQHGWKSDIQIPQQITWEPFYCQELDWILCDAIRRHYKGENEGRTGVIIRGTTRGIEQKDLMKRLKKHQRFSGQDEATILTQLKSDVLDGAYYLIDYRGYEGYEPGDNVVNIFALGCMGSEAIKASDTLLERGIYANVIIVTCTDLLVGNLGHENNFAHLKNGLGIDGSLHLQPLMNGQAQKAEVATLAGRRIPIVSVHDGEPGLLDNIGSIVGTKHEALAVRRHSKCGRPTDVYRFHKIDDEAIVEATGKVLSETALEEVKVSPSVLQQVQGQPAQQTNWRELWPQKH